MSETRESNNSELFTELSEIEQEKASGGLFFIMQKTAITTFAINRINFVSDSGETISSVQQTGYSYSQLNAGFTMTPFWGNQSSSNHRKANWIFFKI
ncbi:MAG TPA: hypothetical protein VK203_05430 [Nostocaceae cyanobacterium]|nr:hypothetical protein [Nostocaceae cyanobacterium]